MKAIIEDEQAEDGVKLRVSNIPTFHVSLSVISTLKSDISTQVVLRIGFKSKVDFFYQTLHA